MHTNVILTNKRCTHAQSNYTNTKLKAWFRCLLRHPARKRSGSILHRYTPGPTRGEEMIYVMINSSNPYIGRLSAPLYYKHATKSLTKQP